MKRNALTHQFVEYLPDELQDGVLYVSIPYATAAHRCCCGCRNEVVTPLSPTDWKLTFDGKSITLHPSIGNWNFPCQSHYFIRRNKVEWVGRMSRERIDAGRAHDRRAKEEHYYDAAANEQASTAVLTDTVPKQGLWNRLTQWWRRQPRKD
jgi:hypothetical protein